MKGTYLNDSVFCWVAASQDVGTRWCLSTDVPLCVTGRGAQAPGGSGQSRAPS